MTGPRLLVTMAVYEEAALIGRAIRSLAGLGVDELHVFDGAWRGGRDGSHTFGSRRSDGRAPNVGSTDGTEQIGEEASWDVFGSDEEQEARGDLGYWWHPCPDGGWPSQEAKRTAMFQQIDAQPGDFILVLDADEEVEPVIDTLSARNVTTLRDELPGLGGHANLLIRCEGPNDMPGIRGEWPVGDYYADWKPELRLFAWNPTLDCLHPGGYYSAGKRIEPYRQAMASNGDTDWGGGVASALPVVESCRIVHHGNDRDEERRAQKLAYYEVEHPERERWQRALEGTA